jgi:hypothetical protein
VGLGLKSVLAITPTHAVLKQMGLRGVGVGMKMANLAMEQLQPRQFLLLWPAVGLGLKSVLATTTHAVLKQIKLRGVGVIISMAH